jgi:hypothetical protein
MRHYTTARYRRFLTGPLGAGIVSESKELAFQTR